MKSEVLFFTTVFSVVILSACVNNIDPLPDACLDSFSISVQSTTNPQCGESDGTITMTNTGEGVITYSLDGGPFQSSGTFSSLPAKLYEVSAQNESGCTTTINVGLDNETDLTLTNIAVNMANCGVSDGSLEISATGGDGNYQYSIAGNTPQTSPIISGLPSGDYDIVVSDGLGCLVYGEAKITSSGASFGVNISPIINTNCAIQGCHDGSRSSLPNFTSFSVIQNQAERIRIRTSRESMPPRSSGLTLTSSEISAIACWVEDGAQNN